MLRCNKLSVSVAKKTGKQEPCKYSNRVCQQPALDNYEYCIKHILEDKTAPFKICGFVYAINGKKCLQPAPKGDRKEGGFCAEHVRKGQVIRQRAGARHCPPQTMETLLASLSHYAPSGELPNRADEMETSDNDHHKTKNPFVEMDATKVNLCGNRILDYVSESDSDVEATTLDSVWKDADRDSSDAESIDSQQEDPLKHAGIYTAEEVAFIAKEKYLRLQSLYIDQLKRLQHVLKERKRKYCHNLLKEKETLASIHSQSKTTAKELKLYEKLKALNRFHKHSSQEGAMHFRLKEKRNQVKKIKKFKKSRLLDPKSEGSSVSPAPTCKCSFTIGGVKCGLKTLPASKFCRKHILEDTHQVLFRPCGCERAEVVCREPTLDIFENASCMLHVNLPAPLHLNIEELKKEVPKRRVGGRGVGGGGDEEDEDDEDEDDEDEEEEEIVDRSEAGVGDVKKEIKTEYPVPSPGPGGDVQQQQQTVDKDNEAVSAEESKRPPNDVVMDDIMANVDVVEEVIMSQPENEQPTSDTTAVNEVCTMSG